MWAAEEHLITANRSCQGWNGSHIDIGVWTTARTLERTGITLISYTSYDVATVVMQLEKVHLTEIYRRMPWQKCENQLYSKIVVSRVSIDSM